MLSYQHAYHAGNPADVHKHAALAWMLDYLTRKDKPLSYIETHAGRGLYDLGGAEAMRTGEAAAGIDRLLPRLPAGHPYGRVVAALRKTHGPRAYPGSPLVAARLLRPDDRLHLAELHPAEHAALRTAMRGSAARLYRQDGLALATSLCPPEPRRGLLLIDPSYEVKTDYTALPARMAKLARAWPVGVIALWYPILRDPLHGPMLAALSKAHPDALRHDVRFDPVRDGHRMVGSGLFVINPPWGLDGALAALKPIFA
jgi:23S rRNA (adenine2030-N6)-methyltransferase